jgi:hypothetical protein
MNKMNEDQQEEIKKLLTDHQWTHAITIHAREPTWGSLWLSITEGFQKICIDNPDLKYWVVGARGSLNDAPHYHGLVYCERPTDLHTRRAIIRFGSIHHDGCQSCPGWPDPLPLVPFRDTIRRGRCAPLHRSSS